MCAHYENPIGDNTIQQHVTIDKFAYDNVQFYRRKQELNIALNYSSPTQNKIKVASEPLKETKY